MLADRLSHGDRPAWCAVSLLREKRAGTVTSSSPQAEALDELQNGFSDGPCLTAVREHTVVRVGDVRDDPRWPDFHAAAADQGVRSVLGVPFDLMGDAKAGLNLYSPTTHDFTPDMIEMVRHEVRHASTALQLAVRLAQHQEAAHDLHAAMSSRTVIDLAVGIIMGQSRCSREDAVAILKAASSHRNVKLRDLAAELVASVDSHEPGTHFEP
ncbi:ANTAR domain-containing protein [Brachybacterium sp. UNK5269]|uniref:GAF and ANTAR domain-containing protein n=1 Tax=Brachybacterium sp. UNK5269 TaxID=3408576 RepID=UPI003BB1F609